MTGIHYRKRFVKGLLIAARILISYKIARLRGIFLSRQRKEIRLRELHRENAVLIREKALEMKGIMIKVGQFLSSRKDFLPDEYIDELSELQDQVPPHDFAEIRHRIIEELGSPPEEIFSVFDKEPIAAQKIAETLDELGADPQDMGLTQGACGGDILFAEACQRRGVKLQLLQPFEEPLFIENSVANDGESWLDRYHTIIQKLDTPPLAAPLELGPLAKEMDAL